MASDWLFSELSSCECDGDRARVRSRFEDQCHEYDSRLRDMVFSRSGDMASLISDTSRYIRVIQEARSRCSLLKSTIIQCMHDLRCKGDDIRKLRMESLQHEYVIKFLARVVELKRTLLEIQDKLNRKEYLEACTTLTSTLGLLEEGDFKDVLAFSDVRAQLRRQRDTFYVIFLEELRQEIYMSTFKKTFSGQCTDKYEEMAYEKVFLSKTTEGIDEYFVGVLIKCMTILDKVPSMTETLKEECNEELTNIVKKLSQFMHNITERSTGFPPWELPEHQQENKFTDLLNTLILHFKQILMNHEQFLNILKEEVPDFKTNILDYICSGIQSVTETFISSYIEVQPKVSPANRSTCFFSDTQNMDEISSFFHSNPYTDFKCQTLFKFANTEQGQHNARKRKDCQPQGRDYEDSRSKTQNLILVCKPSLRNIVFMFKPLKSFVVFIEIALSMAPNVQCPLHSVLRDYTNLFLDQVSTEISKILEAASSSLESWCSTSVPDDEFNSKNEPKQILSSALIIYNNLKSLQQLITELPDYTSHFMHCINYVALHYKDQAQRVFRSLFEEEKSILSVSWARDSDIRRLLRSFSNWAHLEDMSSVDREILESPEDIRMRNIDVSDLLIRNLSPEERDTWRIIDDSTILFNIALLQESLQWLYHRLMALGSNIEKMEEEIAFLPKNQGFKNFQRIQPEESIYSESTSCSNSLTRSHSVGAADNTDPSYSLKTSSSNLEEFVTSQTENEKLPITDPSTCASLENTVSDDKNSDDSLQTTETEENANAKTTEKEISDSSARAIRDLERHAHEYEELSDVCLLTLQLEVSAHCFHYLTPLSAESLLQREFLHRLEKCVKNLTSDLMKIDDVLLPVLTEKEARYVLEGRGELVAALLIQGVSLLRGTWNAALAGGLRRSFFHLQGLLGPGLERARRFTRLLTFRSCEDMLQEVQQEGPRFSLREYMDACRLLLGREEACSQDRLKQCKSDLKRVFKNEEAEDVPS